MNGDSEFPNDGTPRFELRRVADDDSPTAGSAPEIVPISGAWDARGSTPAGAATTRKGFLSGVSAAAALLLLDGCATDREAKNAPSSPAPSPTPSPSARDASAARAKPSPTPAPAKRTKPKSAIRMDDEDLDDADLPILGMPETIERMEFATEDETGAFTRGEQACGLPLPQDAICTCNCVAVPAVTPIPAQYAPTRSRPAQPPDLEEPAEPAPRERGAYSTRDRSEREGPREDADPRKIPDRE